MSESIEKKIEFYKGVAKPGLVEHLGIELETLTPELVSGRMPVDQRTRQPFGVLHGGASVAFAETLASVGGWLNIDHKSAAIVGLEINANHLSPASDGMVSGEARPVHIGKTTQVWSIAIKSEKDRMVCTSRCTLSVISRDKLPALTPG